MFSVLHDTVPIELLRKHDAALVVAEYFRVRPREWDEVAFSDSPGGDLTRIAWTLAKRMASDEDLGFVKLNLVFASAEAADKVANFRNRTGLDTNAILRRCVVSDGASVDDWAALFGFAMDFGWDAAAFSRRKRTLVWFSHDEYVRATPPSLLRRFWT